MFSDWLTPLSSPVISTIASNNNDVDYWTIEGMRSQQFSVGIFIFMVFGVLVFLGIIAMFIKMSAKDTKMKLGEKILFIWIILGVFAAVAFGAAQLLHGRLF